MGGGKINTTRLIVGQWLGGVCLFFRGVRTVFSRFGQFGVQNRIFRDMKNRPNCK